MYYTTAMILIQSVSTDNDSATEYYMKLCTKGLLMCFNTFAAGKV